jgi:hypothetical protein
MIPVQLASASPPQGGEYAKPLEQCSGGFSQLGESLFGEKPDLPLKSSRIDDAELRNIGSRLTSIDHTYRDAKRMIASGCRERDDQACVGAKSSHDHARSDKPLTATVLLGTDVDAKPAPPNFARRVAARLFGVRLLFDLVPPVKTSKSFSILIGEL